ncbi:transport-associated protein [Glaciecola punicea ACAM 611]|jgi:osmotically-inducible protein OsmY|uniref:Transport-associated protein n=1 Tax=Glaciecola punicea ACAM 611 TaxID=1121923 RepID=H5TDA6_9ALTE|nr:BON domain-containing protein [Glaciecola punicea]OFA30124.1 BON domain-containing protein [Glaciecola punicea]GAB56283.1 transport-associated protein [Glaciecola punicea ACAM 611]
MYKKIALTVILGVGVSQLSGCVSAVAVGAAGTAAVSNSDRRTLGTQIDDKTMTARINTAINKIPNLEKDADISVHVYNSQVLLTGQAVSQVLISEVTRVTQTVNQVSKIHNQIRLGAPIPAGSTINDVWLSTKIRTVMSTDSRVPMLKMDLIVEDSEVFIMGQLTKQEATATVELVRNVDGVTKVIRVMELID